MRVARTTTKIAATAATAALLFTGPVSMGPAFAQQTTTTPAAAKVNSVPPPVDKSKRPPLNVAPKQDVPYVQKTACITSGTGNKQLVSKPPGQMQLRLDEAHRFAKGNGITIAIIDTGVNAHPRLADRLVPGGDYVQTGDSGVKDCDGHGTEVAGVAAASKDPETGFVGAAPEAQVLAIRQTSSHYQFEDPAKVDTRKSAGKVTTLAQAIVAAVEKGASVINISLTSCDTPKDPTPGERELQAAVDWAVNERDVVIVTAAGNLGEGGCPAQNDNQNGDKVNVITSPGWYAKDVLSVASMDSFGKPSDFTVWGPWVSLAAPGQEITTLDPAGQGLTNATVTENGAATPIQGTSFASPYVAGVAALVRERFPNLKAHQVMDRLKATAQHPGNPDGRDRKVGAGMINPIAALTAELPSEHGAASPDIKPLMTNLDPVNPKDMTPFVVAMSGTGIGVGLLLLTLFIVHTMNRRKPTPTPTTRRL
jgi:membrane-anchored mycosin MYCP